MTRHLAIVGTGLIGASVGLAARRAGIEHVTGWDPDAAHLATAAERGAVDAAPDLATALDRPRWVSGLPRRNPDR